MSHVTVPRHGALHEAYVCGQFATSHAARATYWRQTAALYPAGCSLRTLYQSYADAWDARAVQSRAARDSWLEVAGWAA